MPSQSDLISPPPGTYGQDNQNYMIGDPLTMPNTANELLEPAVKPASDSQEIYNRMMDLQHAPLARLTAPCDLSAADETPSLVHVDGPDPHFGPALMPRAPSAQSHNSCDDAGCRSGRKAKRTKPLSDYARTKAAFMRKIGSCQECRCRKVSVC